MESIDLASMVFGVVAMLAVGLSATPDAPPPGWKSGILALTFACAVLMRLVGPVPSALVLLALDPVLSRVRDPERRESIRDGLKYLFLAATAVALAFVMVDWLGERLGTNPQ